MNDVKFLQTAKQITCALRSTQPELLQNDRCLTLVVALNVLYDEG